jgi:hypothetical protein
VIDRGTNSEWESGVPSSASQPSLVRDLAAVLSAHLLAQRMRADGHGDMGIEPLQLGKFVPTKIIASGGEAVVLTTDNGDVLRVEPAGTADKHDVNRELRKVAPMILTPLERFECTVPRIGGGEPIAVAVSSFPHLWGTFADWVHSSLSRARGPSDVDEVVVETLRLTARTAAVLVHVHAAGFVIGDVSPWNLLVDQREDPLRLVVTDLGGVRSSTVEGPQQTIAHPACVPPDLPSGAVAWQGITTEQRRDIHGLALTLHAVLLNTLDRRAATPRMLALLEKLFHDDLARSGSMAILRDKLERVVVRATSRTGRWLRATVLAAGLAALAFLIDVATNEAPPVERYVNPEHLANALRLEAARVHEPSAIATLEIEDQLAILYQDHADWGESAGLVMIGEDQAASSPRYEIPDTWSSEVDSTSLELLRLDDGTSAVMVAVTWPPPLNGSRWGALAVAVNRPGLLRVSCVDVQGPHWRCEYFAEAAEPSLLAAFVQRMDGTDLRVDLSGAVEDWRNQNSSQRAFHRASSSIDLLGYHPTLAHISTHYEFYGAPHKQGFVAGSNDRAPIVLLTAPVPGSELADALVVELGCRTPAVGASPESFEAAWAGCLFQPGLAECECLRRSNVHYAFRTPHSPELHGGVDGVLYVVESHSIVTALPNDGTVRSHVVEDGLISRFDPARLEVCTLSRAVAPTDEDPEESLEYLVSCWPDSEELVERCGPLSGQPSPGAFPAALQARTTDGRWTGTLLDGCLVWSASDPLGHSQLSGNWDVAGGGWVAAVLMLPPLGDRCPVGISTIDMHTYCTQYGSCLHLRAKIVEERKGTLLEPAIISLYMESNNWNVGVRLNHFTFEQERAVASVYRPKATPGWVLAPPGCEGPETDQVELEIEDLGDLLPNLTSGESWSHLTIAPNGPILHDFWSNVGELLTGAQQPSSSRATHLPAAALVRTLEQPSPGCP